jgi:RNA polymerase sigma-70 factor (ECF subfamily)
MYRYIYGLHGGPVEEVEDLMAMTYERAWNARFRFEGAPDEALGWLLAIARRLVIDARRKQARRGTTIPLEWAASLAGAGSWENDLVEGEKLHVLWQLLQELPDRKREIIVLRYLLNWPVKTVAAHLGMTDNAVSATIRRTLEDLRDRWPDEPRSLD